MSETLAKPMSMKWTERQTCNRDCRSCHADRGIWRHPVNRKYFLCDRCFARHRDMFARNPDTSDIPEVGEEWFSKARRVEPDGRGGSNG